MLVCRDQAESLMGLNSHSHGCSGTLNRSLPLSLSLSTYPPPTHPPIIRPQFTHPSPSALSPLSLHLLLLCVPSLVFLILSCPFCLSLLSSDPLLLFTHSISLSFSSAKKYLFFYDCIIYNMVSVKYIKYKHGCACVA